MFTLNNYTSSDLDDIQEFAKDGLVVYLCYGLEIAPSTSTPHVQGYFSIRTPTRVNGISRKFPEHSFLARCHFELANGTRQQNAAYCAKTRPGDTPNEVFFESDSSEQGRRTDLERACETLQTSGLAAVAQEHPTTFVKFPNGLKALSERYETPRSTKPTVLWWYGGTGTGKTFTAFEFARTQSLSIWKSSRTLRWWPHYEQQDVALIDDFRKDFITFHGLLTILDRYPETVEVKGGHRQLNSQFFIITSCYPPWSVYETREDVGQLLRRIDQVVRFDRAHEGAGVPQITASVCVKQDPTQPLSIHNHSFGPAGELLRNGFFQRRLRSSSDPSPDGSPGVRRGKRPATSHLERAAHKKGVDLFNCFDELDDLPQFSN